MLNNVQWIVYISSFTLALYGQNYFTPSLYTNEDDSIEDIDLDQRRPINSETDYTKVYIAVTGVLFIIFVYKTKTVKSKKESFVEQTHADSTNRKKFNEMDTRFRRNSNSKKSLKSLNRARSSASSMRRVASEINSRHSQIMNKSGSKSVIYGVKKKKRAFKSTSSNRMANNLKTQSTKLASRENFVPLKVAGSANIKNKKRKNAESENEQEKKDASQNIDRQSSKSLNHRSGDCVIAMGGPCMDVSGRSLSVEKFKRNRFSTPDPAVAKSGHQDASDHMTNQNTINQTSNRHNSSSSGKKNTNDQHTSRHIRDYVNNDIAGHNSKEVGTGGCVGGFSRLTQGLYRDTLENTESLTATIMGENVFPTYVTPSSNATSNQKKTLMY